MKEYIQEVLKRGTFSDLLHQLDYSLLKKEVAFDPVLIYRGLNQIIIKYDYLLPLISSALEQLHSTKITKLTLQHTYILWSTSRNSISGKF